MKYLLPLIVLLCSACPSLTPNNSLDPAAVRQPFLNISARHDMYIRAGFAPPVVDLTTGAVIMGQRLTDTEMSTWLNESALLRKIVIENSGPTLPVPPEPE